MAGGSCTLILALGTSGKGEVRNDVKSFTLWEWERDMSEIEDEFFGWLVWEAGDDWTGEADIPGLGTCRIVVKIEDDDVPRDEQRAQYRQFLRALPSVIEDAQTALVADYEAVEDNPQPPLRAPADIWKRLSRPRVVVPWPEDWRGACILLAWDAQYDPEHGVRVRVVDGRVSCVE